MSAPVDVLAVMDRAVGLIPGSKAAVVTKIELAEARAAVAELIEAATRAGSYMVTEVVESCNGNKCRETWCAGCMGDESAGITVELARKSGLRLRAALARVRGAA